MTAPVTGPRCTACNRNRAVKDGLCRMHHRDFLADRQAAGKRRNPRFSKVLADAPALDRAKSPTIAGIIDRALDVADAVQRGSLEPPQGQAIARCLDLARVCLEGERERAEKKLFAWEEAERRRSTETASADSSSREIGNGDAAVTPPPWMRPAN